MVALAVPSLASAVEVLVDGDQERHDALCVWGLDGYHVIHIQHLRDACFPVEQKDMCTSIVRLSSFLGVQMY